MEKSVVRRITTESPIDDRNPMRKSAVRRITAENPIDDRNPMKNPIDDRNPMENPVEQKSTENPIEKMSEKFQSPKITMEIPVEIFYTFFHRSRDMGRKPTQNSVRENLLWQSP